MYCMHTCQCLCIRAVTVNAIAVISMLNYPLCKSSLASEIAARDHKYHNEIYLFWCSLPPILIWTNSFRTPCTISYGIYTVKPLIYGHLWDVTICPHMGGVLYWEGGRLHLLNNDNMHMCTLTFWIKFVVFYVQCTTVNTLQLWINGKYSTEQFYASSSSSPSSSSGFWPNAGPSLQAEKPRL